MISARRLERKVDDGQHDFGRNRQEGVMIKRQ